MVSKMTITGAPTSVPREATQPRRFFFFCFSRRLTPRRLPIVSISCLSLLGRRTCTTPAIEILRINASDSGHLPTSSRSACRPVPAGRHAAVRACKRAGRFECRRAGGASAPFCGAVSTSFHVLLWGYDEAVMRWLKVAVPAGRRTSRWIVGTGPTSDRRPASPRHSPRVPAGRHQVFFWQGGSAASPWSKNTW